MTSAAIVLAIAAIGLITWGVGALITPRTPAKPAASTTMSYRGRHTRLEG